MEKYEHDDFESKECTRCKQVKLLWEFKKNRTVLSGYGSVCKVCKNAEDRERRLEKKVKWKKTPLWKKLYILDQKEVKSSEPKAIKKKYPAWVLILKKNLRNRNIKKWGVYEVEADDILELYEKQRGLCYYSNMQMDLSNKSNLYKISVDRLDSNLPYTKDNIVLCTVGMNYCKNLFSVEEFTQYLQDLKNSL